LGADNRPHHQHKYAGQIYTFDDDMQGTAATVMAAASSAVRVASTLVRDQRVVIYGAGTAGLGITHRFASR
jgi:malate dehydrogenase (oxaloacetate-decarboxylating)